MAGYAGYTRFYCVLFVVYLIRTATVTEALVHQRIEARSSRGLQEGRFFAEGGYQNSPVACVVPWTYVGSNGESREVQTACVSFDELEPHIGEAQPPIAPSDDRTDDTLWCSTDAEYVRNPEGNNKARRKNWGYCLDTATISPSTAPSASPTVSPSAAPSRAVYLADGGGVESGVCVLPFSVDGVEFTECASIEEVSPYFPTELFQSQYAATDGQTWCAVDFAEYIKDPPGSDKSRRKQWGFCVKESDAVETSNSFFADGGFQEELTPCAASWQFKEKINGDSVFHDASATCIPFSERQPYGYNNPDVTLLEPTQGTTNTGLWCSTTDVYNPDPERDVANRKNWGYCYSSDATAVPTVSPVPIVTTVVPTPPPQVTSTSPTTSPVLTFFADGAFQTSLVECAPTWEFKEKVDGESVFHEVSGTCIPFTERQPYGYEDESVDLLGPTEPTTNRDLWCSTTSVYNANPERDIANRENWGYCYAASFTMSPTVPIAPTGPTTTGPTASPSTLQPSASPTTSQPTITAPIGDGGGVESGDCLIPFTDVRSSQVFYECASIEEFPPHVGSNPFSPRYQETDQTRWCAVEFDEYIAEPTTPDKSRRKKWAYCLDPFGNRTRVTASPTTMTPSSSPTTPGPTPFKVPHSADGGGQAGIRPCAEEWSYKVRPDEDSRAELIPMASQCVSFSEFAPAGFGDLTVFEPTNPLTDRNRWCATAAVYNPEPQGEDNQDNKLLWGFCLDETLTATPTAQPSAVTDAPVASSTAPTDAPSETGLGATGSPVSITPPSAAPSVVGTSAPQGNTTATESAQPTASPSVDPLQEQISVFVAEIGIDSWTESGTIEEIPTLLEDEGVTEAAWDASSQSLIMSVNKPCNTNVASNVYKALKSIYSTFDYGVTCEEKTGRRLQDSNETATTSVVTANVCTDGSCAGPEGSKTPSNSNLVAIIVPCVLVGVVAIATALYVVKKRRSMRKQRDGVTYKPPKEKKKRFPFTFGGFKRPPAPKRPRVLLKRSGGSKKDSATDSEVTPSVEKEGDAFSFNSGPTEETYNQPETNGTSYQYMPQESSGYDAKRGEQSSFAQPTASSMFNSAQGTTSNENTDTATTSPEVVETYVEPISTEETKSAGVTSEVQGSTSADEKKDSAAVKKSSSGKQKKTLTKVQCQKCSATFYSASGKKTCLKCRDDKRKRVCVKCGANFISVSGKSTECTNCRKGTKKQTSETAKSSSQTT